MSASLAHCPTCISLEFSSVLTSLSLRHSLNVICSMGCRFHTMRRLAHHAQHTIARAESNAQKDQRRTKTNLTGPKEKKGLTTNQQQYPSMFCFQLLLYNTSCQVVNLTAKINSIAKTKTEKIKPEHTTKRVRPFRNLSDAYSNETSNQLNTCLLHRITFHCKVTTKFKSASKDLRTLPKQAD
jgi:hypothetical protein